MGLEFIVFVAAILFGILLYWRESNGNGMYRFVNKLVNSKELQMKAEDKKGFVYKQDFLPRLVFVAAFFLVAGVIVQFLSPIEIFTSYNGISALSSMAVGTLLGTYVANFVLKSGKIIDEKKDDLGDIVTDTIEKGKEIIEDISNSDNAIEDEEPAIEAPKKNEKSARDRLKDKGFLK